MNPLMDALKLARDSSIAPAARDIDSSPDSEFFGDRQLEPVRATRGDASPAVISPALLDTGGSFDPETSDAWRPGPIRATRDDMDESAPAPGPLRFHAAPPTDPPRAGTAPDPVIPVDPIRVMDPDASAPGGHVNPSPHERPDVGESPAASGAFDSRDLRRGRGVARVAGIALSLLVVIGAAAGGGHVIWKSEFARPALVGHLSPEAVPVVDPTPVHVVNAPANQSGELTARTASGADGTARLPTPHAPAAAHGAPSTAQPVAREPRGFGGSAAAEARIREDSAGEKAVPDTTVSISLPPTASRPIRTAEIRESERPEQMPARIGRSTAHVSSISSPGHSAQTAPGRRNRLLAADTPRSAAPVLESRTRESRGVAVDAVDFPLPEPNRGGVQPRSDAGSEIVVRKRTRPDHVADWLERAYRAFNSGDGSSAAAAYRVVLGHEPGNRDAHLGLAALAVRGARWNEAAGHYGRVLESHPADTVARAALIAIDERDPARAESRLKALLRSEPNAAHLHFDLGNLYAVQRRWPEAQRSWSKAYHFDRRNADYAYNLAISLDHLSRPESALGLYREALRLSRTRAAGFETAAVLQRIRALDLHVETDPVSDRTPVEAAVAVPAARIR